MRAAVAERPACPSLAGADEWGEFRQFLVGGLARPFCLTRASPGPLP